MPELPPIREAELREWRLLESFGARVGELCGQRVSLGSFSEAQSLVDPAFLEALFGRLAGEIHGPPPQDPREAALYWLAQDSSLWRALPRMDWAIYGGGRAGAPN